MRERERERENGEIERKLSLVLSTARAYFVTLEFLTPFSLVTRLRPKT